VRPPPQLTYPFIGLLLGAGAPIGSFALRYGLFADVRQQPFADLRANAFFYLYELLATAIVFAIAGFVAGRRAHRLRQGESFYHDLAEHDSLTGLHNNRAFMDRYRRATERAVITRQPLAVILVDVDRLKAINDALGHPAGSRALVHVASALRRSKRAADLAARWGGDEFAILLEGADVAAAIRVAEGVMADLRRTAPNVTVTIGIGAAPRPSLPADLFEAADRALLAGKAHGRNTIEVVSI
jgi:diguanylate cyclase (GGDEF)-like protein